MLLVIVIILEDTIAGELADFIHGQFTLRFLGNCLTPGIAAYFWFASEGAGQGYQK